MNLRSVPVASQVTMIAASTLFNGAELITRSLVRIRREHEARHRDH
jgi:hypothetical protein